MRLETIGLFAGCVVIGCTSDPITSTGTTSGPEMGMGSSGVAQATASDDDGGVGPSSGMVEPTEFCGNDIVENDEVCDGTDVGKSSCQSLGFETGDLGCTANCGGYDLTPCGFFICGDGSEDGEEECDGTVGAATCATIGFDNGTLFCTATCEYDTSQCGVCGDGLIGGGEDCDLKKDLPASCGSLGYMTGTLQCSDECLFDVSLCSTCGNDLTEGTEDCDGLDVPGLSCRSEGFDSGTLACQDSCQYDFGSCGTCGNSFTDGDEMCDGNTFGAQTCVTQGFDSGGLTCNAACDTITTENCGTCGNALIDGAEVCDGDLLNGETCLSLGLEGGVLACSATCGLDFSGCDLQGIPFGNDGFYQGLSLEPGVLPCDDISVTGTQLAMGDDTVTLVPMGFAFSFYGSMFTDIWVSANASLNFSAPNPSWTNACMPAAGFNHLLSVFWDDLNPNISGEVSHQTLGTPGNQRFIVQWDLPFIGGDAVDLLRIQAVIHESGNIEMCYPDTQSLLDSGNSGAEATAGIQLDDVTGFQFSCNTPQLVDGLLLMYLPV